MKRKLHLLCNAHIDPVWLWEWQEGAAETLSTFRVAADFCEQYGGFVFNHNEALLYGWIEQYEPALFERIHKLVAQGKWHIMGGWYLQPDCTILSGESFMRQIATGRKYFEEKFGVRPEVAINMDPFGHTRGLVQILAKTGYKGYLFMRPCEMEPGSFIWRGFDGSEVVGHKMYSGYNSLKGQALDKVKEFLDSHPDAQEDQLLLWGIGDHGGGPSRVDLEAINAFAAECGEWDIVHSTPEAYFATIDRSKLHTKECSIVHTMVGCYTSMVRIKQQHRRLEDKLARCEKMLVHANAAYGMDTAISALEDAARSLMLAEFHDILPGSMIHSAEEDSLRLLSHGEEIVDRLTLKAFFALCGGQPKVKEGEIPVIVYNPHPYPVETDVEVEFQLADQNLTPDECTVAQVYDKNGQFLPTQNEKEESNIALDWRKRISFHAVLEPSSVNRFDCTLTVHKNYKPVADCPVEGECYIVEGGGMRTAISRRTGLIESMTMDGKDVLRPGSGMLCAYDDNEDPWGMRVDRFMTNRQQFELLSDEEANAFAGHPGEQCPNVRVVENGAVRTRIQAFFRLGLTTGIVEYTISKHNAYVDVNITLFTGDANKMFRYELGTNTQNAQFLGQTAFGTEEMLSDGSEVTFHEWCGLFGEKDAVAVLNKGTYAGCVADGLLRLSLCRTPAYSAHPIEERPLVPKDRWQEHIDMGRRTFAFRIAAGPSAQLRGHIDRLSQAFNQTPYALAFFPSGAGELPGTLAELDGDGILSACKCVAPGEFRVRVYHPGDKAATLTLSLPGLGASDQSEYGPFEVKTFAVDKNGIRLLEQWDA